jgi:hypothetical protein
LGHIFAYRDSLMQIHYSDILNDISYACQHVLSWDGFDNEKDIEENLFKFISSKVNYKSPLNAYLSELQSILNHKAVLPYVIPDNPNEPLWSGENGLNRDRILLTLPRLIKTGEIKY